MQDRHRSRRDPFVRGTGRAREGRKTRKRLVSQPFPESWLIGAAIIIRGMLPRPGKPAKRLDAGVHVASSADGVLPFVGDAFSVPASNIGRFPDETELTLPEHAGRYRREFLQAARRFCR